MLNSPESNVNTVLAVACLKASVLCLSPCSRAPTYANFYHAESARLHGIVGLRVHQNPAELKKYERGEQIIYRVRDGETYSCCRR